jgi:hypothetical protein
MILPIILFLSVLYHLKSFIVTRSANSVISNQCIYGSKNNKHQSKSTNIKNIESYNKKLLLKELLNEILAEGQTITQLIDEQDEYLLSENGIVEVSDQTKQTNLLNSVIRLYCTHSSPNFNMPWQRQKQEFSSSTGFVLPGRKILTNAHSVEYCSLVQVKKRQSESKFVASVSAGDISFNQKH